jgi:hypothetical protein
MRAPVLHAFLDELEKIAEEAAKKPHPLAPLLGGAAAFGLGTLAGGGAGMLADKAYKHYTGKRIPLPYLAAAAPVIGGGLGLAYNLAQAHQMEQMRRAAEDPDHQR